MRFRIIGERNRAQVLPGRVPEGPGRQAVGRDAGEDRHFRHFGRPKPIDSAGEGADEGVERRHGGRRSGRVGEPLEEPDQVVVLPVAPKHLAVKFRAQNERNVFSRDSFEISRPDTGDIFRGQVQAGADPGAPRSSPP